MSNCKKCDGNVWQPLSDKTGEVYGMVCKRCNPNVKHGRYMNRTITVAKATAAVGTIGEKVRYFIGGVLGLVSASALTIGATYGLITLVVSHV